MKIIKRHQYPIIANRSKSMNYFSTHSNNTKHTNRCMNGDVTTNIWFSQSYYNKGQPKTCVRHFTKLLFI